MGGGIDKWLGRWVDGVEKNTDGWMVSSIHG